MRVVVVVVLKRLVVVLSVVVILLVSGQGVAATEETTQQDTISNDENNENVVSISISTSASVRSTESQPPQPDESIDQQQQQQQQSTSKATTTTKAAAAHHHPSQQQQQQQQQQRAGDTIEDSLFDPLQADPDCLGKEDASCWEPPISTVEQEIEQVEDELCTETETTAEAASATSTATSTATEQQQQCHVVVDKHWGSDPTILHMRDTLRLLGDGVSQRHAATTADDHHPNNSNNNNNNNDRPPIFLLPGLASTRLVAWKYKPCSHPLQKSIKIQDHVWLNINLLMQMKLSDCLRDCLKLGWNQSDTDMLAQESEEGSCKLRPDEGLDAISSLSPGGLTSDLVMGGTNTVYAWLIQWLADNLGYDVSNIVGLPYDWRLSPDKLESRDAFLTLTRRRLEAAVQNNRQPGIMVAHSMGNVIFRYFLNWMRTQLRNEAFQRYVQYYKRRQRQKQKQRQALQKQQAGGGGGGTPSSSGDPLTASSYLPGWMSGMAAGFDDWWASSSSSPTTLGGGGGGDDEGVVDDDRGDDELSLSGEKHAQLWELAQIEGDDNWIEWLEKHIWTYVGLSAPMLGAVNPLRAVISGENMGLPLSDETARIMELTFGSTHSINPISSKEGFCDQWDAERWDEEPASTSNNPKSMRQMDARLACLDDIFTLIEYSRSRESEPDPWENFPALRALMRERKDWDSDFAMIQIVQEYCKEGEKTPCANNSTLDIGPKDAQTGNIFTQFSEIWKEEELPLIVKRDQLRESFWDTDVTNILNRTWERPLIKHVIMAYGVDIPTEVGYVYRKTEQQANKNNKDTGDESSDGIPNIETVLWETAGGRLEEERLEGPRGGLADLLTGKKPKRINQRDGHFEHSGDGSVPYLSLSWAHTWLLHAVRALKYSDGEEEGPNNPLDNIQISHRPKGAMEWKDGPPPKRVEILDKKKVEESSDTGTAHPHGTKYKPEMVRYHNQGTSRTTGIEYTTSVIEAIGVEHKETTRNYDILAAVFTDVLKFMHDDLRSSS